MSRGAADSGSTIDSCGDDCCDLVAPCMGIACKSRARHDSAMAIQGEEFPRDTVVAEKRKGLSALPRPEALTDKVVEMIRQAILSGELAPGARLSVPELARQLGVSRTPARESLLVLEREGLVVPRSSAGMSVMAGGAEDILDLLDIREGLEIMTARRAAERMKAKAVAELRAVLAEHAKVLASGDLMKHIELDAAFHAAIREGAGNPRLARQLVQIDQQLRVLNSRLSRASGWSPRAVLRDHEAIAEAIASGDSASAEKHMRAHIGRSRALHLQSTDRH